MTTSEPPPFAAALIWSINNGYLTVERTVLAVSLISAAAFFAAMRFAD